MNPTYRYEDIIHLSRPVGGRHIPMSRSDRAAQFSPFAALTGYDGVIAESARLTERRIELDEGAIQELNDVLQRIRRELDSQPRVTATWFRPDQWKAGGSYERTSGRVKKLDCHGKRLILTDGTAIPMEDLLQLEL